jgi:hypothetical protein
MLFSAWANDELHAPPFPHRVLGDFAWAGGFYTTLHSYTRTYLVNGFHGRSFRLRNFAPYFLNPPDIAFIVAQSLAAAYPFFGFDFPVFNFEFPRLYPPGALGALHH